MKNLKLSEIINSKYTIVIVSLLSVLFSVGSEGGLGFLILILFCFIVLWTKKWSWSFFGFKRLTNKIPFLLKSFLLAMGIVLFIIIIKPIIENLFGKQDLSFFDALRGDLKIYLIALVQVWIIAAFLEEFIYRGYILQQWERFFGNKTTKSKVLAAIISSIIFGMAHYYQGLSGMILSGIIGLILSLIFYINQRNLFQIILVHGIVDTIFLTLVLTNLDKLIF